MWPRVNPFEGIDAQLRHLIQVMRECPCSAAGLVQMKNLLWRRDQLLEQRYSEQQQTSAVR
jgi:hypothetical protein